MDSFVPGLGDFIWHDRLNRRYLFAFLFFAVIVWVIFKFLYPYPNIIFDSYNYMRAAALHWNFNAWPIGYSKILQFFTGFSHSANLLVTVQYFFLELSFAVFFFTWLYFFRPRKGISHTLFVFLFLNPIFAYTSNYILSDPFFIGLSILWITQLLWIVYRPSPYMILTNAILLTLAFTIRYSALYYPFVVILAFILSRQPVKLKLGGIFLPILLMGAFIQYTSSQAAAISGQKQFSAFGSWKLANDAIYAYGHVLPGNTDTVPPKFRLLDNTVRQYFQATNDPADLQDTADGSSGSYYMFALNSPLVLYMNGLYGNEWPFLNTRKWLTVAPLYQDYGMYLIRKYPATFVRYFLWPNFLRYAAPPGEILGSKTGFSLHESFGGNYQRQLFTLTTIDTNPYFVDWGVGILTAYSSILPMIHMAFFLGMLGFLALRGFTGMNRPQRFCMLLIVGLWCIDLGFSVLSAGVVLRYQLFVMVPEMAAGLYFIEYVYRNIDKKEEIKIAPQRDAIRT